MAAGTRERNYDLLRVVSMFAIVVLHISGVWVSGMMADVAQGDTALWHPQALCAVNSLVRFAVPCFLMLSGAFLLGNPKNASFPGFYRKSLFRIVIPTLLFTAFYLAWQAVLLVWLGVGSPEQIFWSAVRGAPSYHMWYMYMLIVAYACVPFLVRFAQTVSVRAFACAAFGFLLIAMACRWTSGDPWANWDIGQGVEYAGYFMAGYAIRRSARKGTAGGIALVAAGAVLFLGIARLECAYQVMTGGKGPGIWANGVVEPFCLPVTAASLLVFAGFSKLDVRLCGKRRLLDGMARLSFAVYLVHAFVLDLAQRLMGLAGMPLRQLDWLVWLPALFVVVSVASFGLAALYQHWYDRCIMSRIR